MGCSRACLGGKRDFLVKRGKQVRLTRKLVALAIVDGWIKQLIMLHPRNCNWMPWAKGLDGDVGCGGNRGMRCLDPAGPCLDNCWLWLSETSEARRGVCRATLGEEWASKRGAGGREKCFPQNPTRDTKPTVASLV